LQIIFRERSTISIMTCRRGRDKSVGYNDELLKAYRVSTTVEGCQGVAQSVFLLYKIQGTGCVAEPNVPGTLIGISMASKLY